ncbi:MAG TPA: formylglycine-generating enzyme family protein [Xanthobacteraceae bacterium]|jgi:formylglycine-generating enzyme required for sulfatase activity
MWIVFIVKALRMRARSRKLLPGIVLAVLALAASNRGYPQERKDREFRECPDCPEMVGIPAGKFLMGSLANEPGRFNTEGPQHVVMIKAFALGKYDITSRQFLAFLKRTHYQPIPCNSTLGMGWRSAREGSVYSPEYEEPPKWPAVCLDWRDADAYVAWLNAKVRHLRPDLTPGRGPYRLPSEAEWEYAARAGTATARWWGDAIGTNRANCNGCGSPWDDKLLADVDSFAPNPFGLYGLLGNAWQWTADCWHINYKDAPTDGSAWVEKNCTRHVIRGGSWDNLPVFVRSASRSGSVSDGGEYDYSSLTGFRVARDLP